MKKVIDSISFWIGFTFGVILFLVINVSDVVKQSSRICFDCDKGYGKPFRIYESGSMIHNREILWGGGNCGCSNRIDCQHNNWLGLLLYSGGAFQTLVSKIKIVFNLPNIRVAEIPVRGKGESSFYGNPRSFDVPDVQQWPLICWSSTFSVVESRPRFRHLSC